MFTFALIGVGAFAVVGAGIAIVFSDNGGDGTESTGKSTEAKRVSKVPNPLLDAFSNIAYGNELDQFKLVERTAKKTKFQYLYGGYLFTVMVKEDMVSCKVEKGDAVLIDYVFDQGWDEYDKKVIARSVLEFGDRDEILDLTEDWMDEINNYDWSNFDDSLIVIDDSNGEPQLIDGFEVPLATESIFPKKISDVKAFVLSHEVEEEVQEKFLTAIEKVAEAGSRLTTLDIKLDVESQHVYEELIEKDIAKLFTAYVNLNEEKKGEYQEKIFEGVERITAKANGLLEKIEKRKVHEIESVLHVIGERYDK